MSIKEKREAVLEKIYDELLEGGLDDFKPETRSFGTDGKKGPQMVQLIVALEDAEAKEAELAAKSEELAFDNANHEIDVEHDDRKELIKILVTSGITIVTNVIWGVIFVHELKQTRLFEVEGTETSAAGRWLKQSFPKFGRL